MTLTPYTKGEPCYIRVYVPTIGNVELAGIITSESPLKARVTERDPVWHGCEFSAREIRRKRFKAKPKSKLIN
jgi:hypothetical protein